MRKIRLQRDSQQWMFDWMVKETGRVFHWDQEGRGELPTTVKSHAMISKHLGKRALRQQRVAREEEEAGHIETAMDFYFMAATTLAAAQHAVMEDDSEEKLFLHSLSLSCYDKVIQYAPYPIERVEVPWQGMQIQCNLHLLPDRRRAPCAIFIPGCDMTKELYPYPRQNHAHQRGMHMLVMDGPGQGMSNIRKIRLTADNYEQAGSAVIDYLLTRPEIDGDKIAVDGISFGSFWGMRLAAHDPRVRAFAGPLASYVDKSYLLDETSPRFKQLFVYLTGAESEESLDRIVAGMTMDGHASRIRCPVLMTVGEYDPRSPIELVHNLFDQIGAPKELWVFEDQYHMTTLFGAQNVAGMDIHMLALDWLRDALAGRFGPGHARTLYLQVGGAGPSSKGVSTRSARRWWEEDRRQ